MEAILDQFSYMFEDIGEVKLPPRPVAQNQRHIPMHMLEPLKEKLEEFVWESVLRGP